MIIVTYARPLLLACTFFDERLIAKLSLIVGTSSFSIMVGFLTTILRGGTIKIIESVLFSNLTTLLKESKYNRGL